MENTESKQIIPLNIFQTWFTKNLEPGMARAIKSIKDKNPEFKYYLYDDNDCRNFIAQNFDKDVLFAYDNLIPGAYRADLWRYCILFAKGGIYLDIKYTAMGRKLIDFTYKNYFVLDRANHWKPKQLGVYNAFMISEAKNPLFLKCIHKIVENVKTCNYDLNALYPTGPGLIGSFFNKDYVFEMIFSDCGKYIKYKDEKILKIYDDYRMEQIKTQIFPYYSKLWQQKMVYKQNIKKNFSDLALRTVVFKEYYNIVPLNIYQINYEMLQGKELNDRTSQIRNANGEFGYFLFNIHDMGEYIRKNFDYKVHIAFLNLKSLKYKIDLWKYCILYKNGGIYIDINFNLNDKFKFFNYVYKEFFVKNKQSETIFSDVLMCEPKNNKLLTCINDIVALVESKNYPMEWSMITGDKQLSRNFNEEEINEIQLIFNYNKCYHEDGMIVDNVEDGYYKLVDEARNDFNERNIF